MHNAKIARIADTMQRLVDQVKAEALERCAALGIKPGAKVRCFRYDGTPNGDYIVARIDTKHRLWIYGYKCRRDGTVGRHQHSVENAERVEVLSENPVFIR